MRYRLIAFFMTAAALGCLYVGCAGLGEYVSSPEGQADLSAAAGTAVGSLGAGPIGWAIAGTSIVANLLQGYKAHQTKKKADAAPAGGTTP